MPAAELHLLLLGLLDLLVRQGRQPEGHRCYEQWSPGNRGWSAAGARGRRCAGCRAREASEGSAKEAMAAAADMANFLGLEIDASDTM